MAARYGEEELVVEIQDDGKGFDPDETQSRRDGLGLRGMRDRVDLFGGRLDVRSGRGEGTVVTAWIPLETGS